MRGVNSQRAVVGIPISRPLFLKYRTTGTVMSAITSTTEAPQELILHGTLEICLKKLASRTRNKDLKQDFLFRAATAGRVYKDLLDDADLAKPKAKSAGPRRVSVPW